MNLSNQCIILTGAAGGIGSSLALKLAQKGAKLLLVDRDAARLEAVQQQIAAAGSVAHIYPCDLGASDVHPKIALQAQEMLGRIDLLINNAGILSFIPYEDQSPAQIEAIMRVNSIAPMLLVREVLPKMLEQGSGRIVNIGSTFGTIGFPHFVAYSASKFAVRGFSEALRRELVDTPIGVTYIAPRAVKTPINTDAVTRMLEKTGSGMDDPELVAGIIVQAIESECKDRYIGWPERFFAKLNSILPRLVDGGLVEKTRIAREFAKPPRN